VVHVSNRNWESRTKWIGREWGKYLLV